MNPHTLDDLRRTLDAHAGDVHDDTARARTAAVRGRAAVVRRRRAAGAGAVAALALAGGLLLPQLGTDEPQPLGRTLVGKVAPATLQSLGYTYRFVEGTEVDRGDASVRLRPSDRPRLISWASEASDVTIETTLEGRRIPSSDVAFDDFVLVPAGERGTWTVRAASYDTALAVYELDPSVLPAGETVGDGLHFRQEVGDEQLVTAAALDEGEEVLTVTATVPENERMRVAEFCTGVPEDLWVNVSIDDDGAAASGGCSDDGFDPAHGNAQWLEARHLPEPGEEVEVRMWVSDEVDGEPLVHEGARLALGLYDVADPVAVVGGWQMAAVVEHEGHRWSYVDSAEVGAGESALVLRNRQGVPVLAVGTHERAGSSVTMKVIGGDQVTRNSAGLGGSSTLGTVQPGGTARVASRGPLGPRGSMGITFYARVD